MKIKETQRLQIKARLEKYGYVDNYWSVLKAGIWRLSGIILLLKREGMKIKGGYEVKKGKITKNYVYRLVK